MEIYLDNSVTTRVCPEAAEAAMPDLAALEAEAAENVEKIAIRMGEDELL